MQSSSTILYFT